MNCKSCGAPIKWVITEKGKKMPVNFPGARRLVLDAANVARVAITYTSHLDTCPHSAQHRRNR